VRAVVQHRRGVEDVVPLVHEAEDGRQSPALLRDLPEGPQVGFDEGRLEEQVLGRVAGQRQLGEGDDVAAGDARARHPVNDHARIGLDGAHRRVDLSQPHPHSSHGRILAYEARLDRFARTAT
jgi:hypothetical protein